MSLQDLTPWLVLLMVRATVILLAGAATVALLRRRSASGRHAVLALTVLALLMMPLLSVVGPRWDIALLPAATRMPAGEAPVSFFRERPHGDEPRGRHDAVRTPAVIPRASSTLASTASGEGRTTYREVDEGADRRALLSANGLRSVLSWLPAVWLLGVALGALHMVRSALIIRSTLRRATVVDDTEWTSALDDASATVGVPRRVRLLMSDAVSVPVVHGFADPAIVVPTTCTEWPSDRRRAFLLHELAHVRRQDWLAQRAGQVAQALYWLHPIAWWAFRRLRAEAERACDDCVLLAGTPAADYADHLLQAARDLRRSSPPLAVLAVVERSRFEDRLLAVLDPHLRRTVPDRRVLGLGAATAFMFVFAVGGLQPVTRAAAETAERQTNDHALSQEAAPEQPTVARAADAAPARPPAIEGAAGRSRPEHAVALAIVSGDDIAAPAAALSSPAGGEPSDSPNPDEDAVSAAPARNEVPAPSAPAPEPSATLAAARNLPVIRIATDVVQIDAVVTDKSGRQVTDLRPEDFEVFQDGRKQIVSHVQYVATGPGPGPGAVAVAAATSSAVPDDTEPRTLVFVVDDLGLSLESAVRTRRLLEDFARSGLGPRDRAAIIETSSVGKTHLLTSDAEALGAAASAIRFRVASRANLERANLDRRPYRLDETSLHSQRVMESLHALKRTIDALRWVPGRKAVILLSEGFTTRVSRDDDRLLQHYTSTSVDALYGDTSLQSALRSLTDLANRASVVIYALDPLGLQPDVAIRGGGLLGGVSSAASQSDSGDLTGRAAGYGPSGSGAWREVSAARMARQDSLIELAEQTGGLAVTDHNDLAGGLGRILADHSGYYLIGYEPGRETFAGSGRPRFHKVRVEVKRRGVDVRSRKGFYGVTDEVVAQAAPEASR
jgi:VWFA-related protein